MKAACEAGFSYTEALIATTILAVALVPAVDSLTTGARSAAHHGDVVERHYHVRGRLEELLARPFAELDAAAREAGASTRATRFSDPEGSPRRRLVYLARYDADNADRDADPFTGGDAGLLWIAVQLEGLDAQVQTLRSD